MTESRQDSLYRPNSRHFRFGTRLVLAAGFGGLLTLMASTSIDAIRMVRRIEASNTQIHRDFLSRERKLDEIRSAVYLSGSVVRDYILLDPGEATTLMLRDELRSIRTEMDAAMEVYRRFLRPQEQEAFHTLSAEVDSYWSVLSPIFEWDTDTKRSQGYWYLRTELFPKRATVLAIARDVAAVNEETLKEGERQVNEVFAGFRRRLLTATIAGLGLGVVVAFLSIVSILRLERDSDQRYRESLRAQAELKDLSARLVDAQEQERRAISRELHDEVGQSLTALLMDAGNLAAATQASNGEFRQRLENIQRLAENSVNAVRNMALLLRPSMLDDLGLVAALEWQAREVTKRTGLLVELVEENVCAALPDEYSTCVYRVVQEALHNCSRHAAARQARIVLRQQPERLLLTIEDDGKGFDARRVRGLGLVGMAERVARLGGEFHVESEPGRGALVQVELPLAQRPAAAAETAR